VAGTPPIQSVSAPALPALVPYRAAGQFVAAAIDHRSGRSDAWVGCPPCLPSPLCGTCPLLGGVGRAGALAIRCSQYAADRQWTGVRCSPLASPPEVVPTRLGHAGRLGVRGRIAAGKFLGLQRRGTPAGTSLGVACSNVFDKFTQRDTIPGGADAPTVREGTEAKAIQPAIPTGPDYHAIPNKVGEYGRCLQGGYA
jgi:hypothetical protein